MSYFIRQQRFSIRHVLILAAALGLATTACGGPDESAVTAPSTTSSSTVDLMAPADFSAFLDDDPDVPLINVHVPYEGHIDGTDAFIAFDSILESADLPTDRSAPIALYCRSGNMSGQAAADLAEAGYTNVIDLEGGMNAWAASGNGLVVDPSIDDD